MDATSSDHVETPLETDVSNAENQLRETRQALVDLAGRRLGTLPIAPLIELLLTHTEGADWPVRRAAMEALVRRAGFAKRDGTEVLSRPKRGSLGVYRVGSKAVGEGKAPRGARSASSKKAGGAVARSYETELCSLEPLRTSCNCPDFVRGSLGLCKHGLCVLLSLGPSVFSNDKRAAGHLTREPRLAWNASAPLSGADDRLARLSLSGAPRAVASFERSLRSALASPQAAVRLKWIDQQLLAVREGRWAAEPAAKRVLEEERVRAARLVANAASLRRAESATSKLKRKLYDYQKQGVRQFLQTGRLLLADDMGLGKTTQAIACCHALLTTGRIQRGLLVVPASLRSQWLREWEQTTDIELLEVQGGPSERAAIYRGTKRGFLLIGYELLLRDLPHVQAFDPEFVLLDEAQRIKNWATKSAASVKSLSPEYRLVLTGTPMENRFDELASIMDFVDDTALEPKWRLVPWHSISVGNADRGVGGARNLGLLRQRLGASFLRRRRAEVLSQLPPRTETRIAVELTPEQMDEHVALDRPIAALVRKAQTRPLLQAEFLRLMQLLTTQRMICNGLAQLHFDEEWPRCQATSRPSERFLHSLYSPKLGAFRDLVEQLVVGQERKLVVFSQWRKMLRLANWSVAELLAAANKRAVFFTGAESRKARERALVDFHDDPAVAVLFLSDAGGVGLNLQRAASCVVNLELPWNPAVLEQRIGRVYRLGQDEPVEVLNLVSEGGIEARIAELVARKQAVFSTLFDGTSDEVLFDGDRSFLSGVKQLLEPAELDAALEARDDNADDEASELDELVMQAARRADPRTDADASLLPDRAAPAIGVTARGSAEPGGGIPGIVVEATDGGGLRIEAPPELAGPLAQILQSLAAALSGVAQAGANAPPGRRTP